MDPEAEEEELLAEADQQVREAESLLPKEEWNRLVRLDGISTWLSGAIGLGLFVSLYVAVRYGDDLLEAFRSGPAARTTILVWTVGWLMVAITLAAARLIARRRCEGIYRALGRRGYDAEKIRDAVGARAYRDVVQEERWEEEEQKADEQHWERERATAGPWWRTELTGGQLLLNLYILAGSAVAAIPQLRIHDTLVPLIPLAALAFIVKFVIPAIFAAAMLTTVERKQGLRDTWRYYRWWARSRVALGILVLLGLLVALLIISPAPASGPTDGLGAG